jgi:acetoin utilization protein AcuB
MLVKNWMSKAVVKIDVEDSMQQALKLMKENNIRMLPVMKRGKLVGVVTDRDLKSASASDATTLDVHELLYLISKIKVKEIMTPDPLTVPEDFTIEEAADLLMKNKISGVPVLSPRGEVVGTITMTDLARVIVSLTGLAKRGIQFGFLVPDSAGSIKALADIIRHYDARMVSILSSHENVPKDYRKVYIRIYDLDRARLRDLQAELKQKATLLYMVDHRENRREIY